jgi:hypothetical protein
VRARGSESGQAFTETMLVSWLFLIFIAAMWQLFIVNDTIFRSIVAAHAIVFKQGYARNTDSTGYDREQVVAIWSRPDMPEAEIPVINMFSAAVGKSSVKINSIVESDRKKRTRMGSGTAGPQGLGGVFDYFIHLGEMAAEVASHPQEYASAYWQRLGY